ncbi:hypothetical protein BESB_002800 [Besnoitia besnoiti]|uniref:Cation/H+ exchanger transmembrane domain-containing protein n=1 Tax=Besnoitia besnoiti TaxID=94643 RepID=A0A2A9MJ49_BESBE|nr:hypothetical protein BESB_002800 [Besnoitia besnoiti]PFH37939.1 hypothetical protein BESB_002800 [Besnoitia besnoiti]
MAVGGCSSSAVVSASSPSPSKRRLSWSSCDGPRQTPGSPSSEARRDEECKKIQPRRVSGACAEEETDLLHRPGDGAAETENIWRKIRKKRFKLTHADEGGVTEGGHSADETAEETPPCCSDADSDDERAEASLRRLLAAFSAFSSPSSGASFPPTAAPSSYDARLWKAPKARLSSVSSAWLPLAALLLLVCFSFLFKALPHILGRPLTRTHASVFSSPQQALSQFFPPPTATAPAPSTSLSSLSLPADLFPASSAPPPAPSGRPAGDSRRLADVAETERGSLPSVSAFNTSVVFPEPDGSASERAEPNPIASTLAFFCFLFFSAVFLQWLISKIPSYPPPVSIVWFVFGMVAYGIASAPALLPPQEEPSATAGGAGASGDPAGLPAGSTGIGDVPMKGHNLLQTGILEMRVIDSNVVYFVLVPILLYEATQSINWHKFKRFLAGGLLLAVLGVAVQVGVLGLMFYYTYMKEYVKSAEETDQNPLTAAFLLASTLSSTDPVAVLSVLNAVNASDKLCTMFDGESLINDGSAVLLFQFFFYLLQGVSETPLSTFIMFMKLLFAGPALGCFLGFAVYLWLNCFRRYPMTQCLAVITVCYIAYFVAEVAFSLSGPLTAVCYGLFIKSYGHIALDREAQLKHHTLVEGLGLMANCAIFIISGIVTYGMMSSVFSRSDGGLYWVHLLLTYIYLNLARIFMIVLFSPFLRRTGYGLTWKEAVLLIWGGLRGGIVLALGLRIERDGNLEGELTKALSFFISGSVFLILLIHGMTFELLYRWLNPYPPKPFRRVYLEAVMKMIDYQYMEEKQALNSHWLFKGTDVLVHADKVVPVLGWGKVDRLKNMNLKVPDISVAFSCLHDASFNTWVVPTAFSVRPSATLVKRMETGPLGLGARGSFAQPEDAGAQGRDHLDEGRGEKGGRKGLASYQEEEFAPLPLTDDEFAGGDAVKRSPLQLSRKAPERSVMLAVDASLALEETREGERIGGHVGRRPYESLGTSSPADRAGVASPADVAPSGFAHASGVNRHRVGADSGLYRTGDVSESPFGPSSLSEGARPSTGPGTAERHRSRPSTERSTHFVPPGGVASPPTSGVSSIAGGGNRIPPFSSVVPGGEGERERRGSAPSRRQGAELAAAAQRRARSPSPAARAAGAGGDGAVVGRELERGREPAPVSPRYFAKSQLLPVDGDYANPSPILSQAPSLVFHSLQAPPHGDGAGQRVPPLATRPARDGRGIEDDKESLMQSYRKEKQAHTLAALSQGLKPELGGGIGASSAFDPKFNLRLIEHATTVDGPPVSAGGAAGPPGTAQQAAGTRGVSEANAPDASAAAAGVSSRRKRSRGLRLHSRRTEAEDGFGARASSSDLSSQESDSDVVEDKPIEVILEGEDPETKLPLYRLTSTRAGHRALLDGDGDKAAGFSAVGDGGQRLAQERHGARDARHPGHWASALLSTFRLRRTRGQGGLDSAVTDKQFPAGGGSRTPIRRSFRSRRRDDDEGLGLADGAPGDLASTQDRQGGLATQDADCKVAAKSGKGRRGRRIGPPLALLSKRGMSTGSRRARAEASPRTAARPKGEAGDVGNDDSTSGDARKLDDGALRGGEEGGEEDDVLQDIPRHSDEDDDFDYDRRLPGRLDTDATLVFHHKDLDPGVRKRKKKARKAGGVSLRVHSLLHLPYHRGRRGSDASRSNPQVSPPSSPRPAGGSDGEPHGGGASSPQALTVSDGVLFKGATDRRNGGGCCSASVSPPSVVLLPDAEPRGESRLTAADGRPEEDARDTGLRLLTRSLENMRTDAQERERSRSGGAPLPSLPSAARKLQDSVYTPEATAMPTFPPSAPVGNKGTFAVPLAGLQHPAAAGAVGTYQPRDEQTGKGSGKPGSGKVTTRRVGWNKRGTLQGVKARRILLRGRKTALGVRERAMSTDYNAGERASVSSGGLDLKWAGRDTRSEGGQSVAHEAENLEDLKRSLSLGSSESYFEIPATPRRGSFSSSHQSGGKAVEPAFRRDAQRAGSRRKVLRKEREGELYLMFFNACREMYHRLYHKNCIGGSALLSLNTSLDLSNDFAVGKVRQNPIRAWAEVLQEDAHGAADKRSKSGPKKRTLQTLTGFEYEWSVLQSRLHCMQEQQQGWCGLRAAPFCCGRRIPSAFMRSLLNSGACQSDLEQILAFVDVHEELLEKGGKNMQQLMGEELLASYNRQILSAKRFVLYIRDCYPDSFRVAICKIAATLLLNLKTKLVKDTAQKGLVLEEDKETLLRILDEQQFRLSRFRPCFIFIRPQNCVPSGMGNVLALGVRGRANSINSSSSSASQAARDAVAVRSPSTEEADYDRGRDLENHEDAEPGDRRHTEDELLGLIQRGDEARRTAGGRKSRPSVWEAEWARNGDGPDEEEKRLGERHRQASVIRMMDSGRHMQPLPLEAEIRVYCLQHQRRLGHDDSETRNGEAAEAAELVALNRFRSAA